ncbi:hypothetical protein ABTZ21_17600 [Streptomyces sp. NPDC096191]|uniref:hypothetical protein n=1 Tax=Streptomyces sp. NPDC096191 TaxID=3155426 RepID=UPI0033197256
MPLSLPVDAGAYVCGPEGFMDDMRQALHASGIDPARTHTEAFSALPALRPGIAPQGVAAPHQPVGEPGTGPQVTFARSGLATRYPATGEVLFCCARPDGDVVLDM